MKYVLEVQKLSKNYPNSEFQLKDISFNIPKSSIIGFIGENGAGKTTTIGAILGFKNKKNGIIKIFGKEEPYGVDVKENIGVVSENINFTDNINITQLSRVLRNIYRQWDNEKFFYYIDLFSLPKEGIVGELSRGMSMKLSIAVALSHGAKLLLLDEATSGLDPVSRDEVLNLLEGYVQTSGSSILLSSHIISDIEKIADYLLFIKSGEILLEISKEELLNNFTIIECKLEDLNNFKDIAICYAYKSDLLVEVLISNKKKLSGHYLQSSLNEITLLLMRGERV